MPIYSGSRYQGVDYTGTLDRNGKERKLLHDRRIFSLDDVKDDAIEHTVSGKERLDTIADTYYQDEDLWYLIADVNDVFYKDDVVPGQVLVIPNPEIVDDLRNNGE